MANISNSTLLDVIDQMAAVSKAQAAAYTSTVDLFDIVVREKNPDDVVNGASAANTTDLALDAGSSQYAQWTNMQTWLSTRATDAGSTSIPTLISGRYLRVPESYDSYVYYPSVGSHFTAAYVFPDTEDVWGTVVAADGSTWTGASGAMPSNCTTAAFAIEVTSASIDSTYVVSGTATYVDDTTGTETATATGLTQGDKELFAYNMVSDLSTLGTDILYMGDTTKMVADMAVLLQDRTYPTLMVADTPLSQPYAYFTPAQLGWYDTGDAVYLKKVGGTDRSYTIEDIDYREGKVKFTTNIATDAYVLADNAFMRLQTARGDGWTEVHLIDTVNASTSLKLTGNLQHTYYTAAKAVRLLKKIEACSATGGGTGVVDVQIYPDRTIAQA